MGAKPPLGGESRMKHPSWSWGRVSGLGAVRQPLLSTHPSLGRVALRSVQKRRENRCPGCRSTLGHVGVWAGRGGHQQALWGAQDAQILQRWAGGDACDTERRKVITSRNMAPGKPGKRTQLAPGERLEERHSHFSGPSRWERYEGTHAAGCVSGRTPPPPRRAPRSRLTGQG